MSEKADEFIPAEDAFDDTQIRVEALNAIENAETFILFAISADRSMDTLFLPLSVPGEERARRAAGLLALAAIEAHRLMVIAIKISREVAEDGEKPNGD